LPVIYVLVFIAHVSSGLPLYISSFTTIFSLFDSTAPSVLSVSEILLSASTPDRLFPCLNQILFSVERYPPLHILLETPTPSSNSLAFEERPFQEGFAEDFGPLSSSSRRFPLCFDFPYLLILPVGSSRLNPFLPRRFPDKRIWMFLLRCLSLSVGATFSYDTIRLLHSDHFAPHLFFLLKVRHTSPLS